MKKFSFISIVGMTAEDLAIEYMDRAEGVLKKKLKMHLSFNADAFDMKESDIDDLFNELQEALDELQDMEDNDEEC